MRGMVLPLQALEDMNLERGGLFFVLLGEEEKKMWTAVPARYKYKYCILHSKVSRAWVGR